MDPAVDAAGIRCIYVCLRKQESDSPCACIPYNEQEDSKPFCLEFDDLTCIPLSHAPNCYPLFIYKSQAQCLATIFQSEPKHPCSLATKDFCLENHIAICDISGQPTSCFNDYDQ